MFHFLLGSRKEKDEDERWFLTWEKPTWLAAATCGTTEERGHGRIHGHQNGNDREKRNETFVTLDYNR